MWIFFIVSMLVLIGVLFFMPKRISRIELYTGYLLMLIISWSINVLIDAKFNLRSFFQRGPDHLTMLIYIIIFPCIGAIFLNFYPYRQSMIKKTAYILLAVLLFLGYDILLVKVNILHFYKWNYIYSTFLYIIEFLGVLSNMKIMSYLKSTDN